MAKCDEGYLCEVCHDEVEGILQSDLYLRFVIGEVDPERLHTTPERHIRCNPVLAQFIQAPDAPSYEHADVPEGFRLSDLDPSFVVERQQLVTRGWERLRELAEQGDAVAIHEYPLEDVRSKWF